MSAIDDIKKLVDIQMKDGNWNYDPYMLGMANGTIMCLAILEGKNPAYLDKPEKWLSDFPEQLPFKIENDLTDSQGRKWVVTED